MGIVISRLRKKKTAVHILESLEEDIKSLENDKVTTLERQKRIFGYFMLFSCALYIIAAVILYFKYLPASSLKDGIFYGLPLFVFFVLIYFSKRGITWYFKREIILNKEKLIDLRAKKKKILDEVMEKETFKVAKAILEKFAPDQLSKVPSSSSIASISQAKLSNVTQKVPTMPQKVQNTIEKNNLTMAPVISKNQTIQQKKFSTIVPSITQPFGVSPTSMASSIPRSQLQRQSFPLIHPNRSYLDRFVEFLTGDGPNNRYALICANCSTHNGMALKEEFEYTAFRCLYCGFPNPSRKTRLRPPVMRQLAHPEVLIQEVHSEDETSEISLNKDDTSNNNEKDCLETSGAVNECSAIEENNLNENIVVDKIVEKNFDNVDTYAEKENHFFNESSDDKKKLNCDETTPEVID